MTSSKSRDLAQSRGGWARTSSWRQDGDEHAQEKKSLWRQRSQEGLGEDSQLCLFYSPKVSEGLVSREWREWARGVSSDAKGMWAQAGAQGENRRRGSAAQGRGKVWAEQGCGGPSLPIPPTCSSSNPSPLDIWAASGQEEGRKTKKKKIRQHKI